MKRFRFLLWALSFSTFANATSQLDAHTGPEDSLPTNVGKKEIIPMREVDEEIDLFTPSCFGEKNNGVEVEGLNESDQRDEGTCYAHAPVTIAEFSHFRRSGSPRKLSVDFALYLDRMKSDTVSYARALRNAVKGEVPVQGGFPREVLQAFLAAGSIPLEKSKAGKEMQKFLSDYQRQVERDATLVRIESEKLQLQEEYERYRSRRESLSRKYADFRIYESKRAKAQAEVHLYQDYSDRFDAEGKPLNGLSDHPRWVEIEKAQRNYPKNKKFLENHLKKHPNSSVYQALGDKLLSLSKKNLEDQMAFAEKHKESLITDFSQKFCVEGECLAPLIDELKAKHPKDFVSMSGFSRFFIKEEMFGPQTSCNPLKLFLRINELLCLGVPLLADGIPMGGESPVHTVTENGAKGPPSPMSQKQSAGMHAAVLKGIRRNEATREYEIIFHNNWGPGKDLAMPASQLCLVGDFQALLDTQVHSGEGVSETQIMSDLMSGQKLTLEKAAPLLGSVRKSFRTVYPLPKNATQSGSD